MSKTIQPPRVLDNNGKLIRPNGSYDLCLDTPVAKGHDDPGSWTLLTAEGGILTKRWFASRQYGDYPYQRQEGAVRPQQSLYKASRIRLDSLDRIAEVRRTIEANQMLIPGGLTKAAARKSKVRAVGNRRKSHRAFVDVPRIAWMIDIDSTDLATPEDWLADPEGVTEDVIGHHLPDAFHPAGVVVAAGSSMGPDFSLHLFYLFSRPVWSFEMKNWLGPGDHNDLLDGSLYTPVHPHYIAPPLFHEANGRPAPDPLEDQRLFVFDGDPVEVPDAIPAFVKPKRSQRVNKDGTVGERRPWRELLPFVGRGEGREGYHEFMNTQLIPAFCAQTRRWFPQAERRETFKLQMREHLREVIRAEPTTDPKRHEEALGSEFDRMFEDHWEWRRQLPDEVVDMAGRKLRGEPEEATLDEGMEEAREMIDSALDFWTRGR